MCGPKIYCNPLPNLWKYPCRLPIWVAGNIPSHVKLSIVLINAVIESYQVAGSEMMGGVQFPSDGGILDNSDAGSGNGLEDAILPPATILLPQQLFDGDLGTPISVTNLLVMKADQFFPTSK